MRPDTHNDDPPPPPPPVQAADAHLEAAFDDHYELGDEQ
jgi:hypothetical protein